MINPDNLKKGHVYGNGKGLYRKIRKFTNTLGKEVDFPYDIHWVRCTDSGAVTETAKEQMCWVSTFCGWAKEHIGDVGNLAGLEGDPDAQR